eukprot:31275-Pelagococcus_subviridis.AAC.12
MDADGWSTSRTRRECALAGRSGAGGSELDAPWRSRGARTRLSSIASARRAVARVTRGELGEERRDRRFWDGRRRDARAV